MRTRYVEGPTHHGGVHALLWFHDDDGQATEEEHATGVYVVEYDEHGRVIAETWSATPGADRPAGPASAATGA
jgi:YD repeat-containing protein